MAMSTKKVVYAAMFLFAQAAWVGFAEHRTVKNLRLAIGDTLGLL
jgi:hypothetical protein